LFSDIYNFAVIRINAKLGGINSDAYIDIMKDLVQAPYMVCGEY